MSEANDFLMGGGVKSASFPTVGTTVSGTIVRQPELRQQTDVATGKPKFWDDGSPRQQVVVQLATTERDPAVPDDDGVRAIYVKSGLTKPVREAVRLAGAKGLEVGGTLTVTFIGEGDAPGKGMNPPKYYSASYVAAPAVAVNNFLSAGEPAQAAPAPVQAVPQQAPAYLQSAAPVAAPAPAMAAAPAGVDPAALAALQNLTPEQRATLGL